MARPIKVRKVEGLPKQNYFIPVGKRKCEIGEIELKVEELEAMRLKDIVGFSQEECAIQMEVSRQTFQNILEDARKKLTLALVEGKAIRIEGGNFVEKECQYYCEHCGTTYKIQYKIDQEKCPNCGATQITCGKKECGCMKSCKKWK